MSNTGRLRAPDRYNTSARSRLRTALDTAQQLGAPNRVMLRESGTAVADPEVDVDGTPTVVAEAIRIVEASVGTVTPAGGRRYRARLIEGDRWGTSGYYSRRLLESDGPKAWPVGTLMYLDHPTATEAAERPERSVRDLAAQIVTTPAYEGDGLYAQIETFAHADPLIESLKSNVGLSIRANGTAAPGSVGGRTGMVVESLAPSVLNSVDFVTVAGAGGKIISLAEAARTGDIALQEARNIEAWFEAQIHTDFTVAADRMYADGRLTREERITLSTAVGDALAAFTARVEADAPQLAQRDIYQEPDDSGADMAEAASRPVREATAGDIRQALDTAVRAAYGVEGDSTQWLWVRDYDPDQGLVWFDDCDNDVQATWQQGYDITDGDTAPIATLTGERTAVFARTEYVPVPPPDDPDEGDGVGGMDGMDMAGMNEAATTTDVTDGAPPTAPNPPRLETGVSGTQNTGPAPGAAGTTEASTAVPAAVTEAQNAQRAAEVALDEANRQRIAAQAELARFRAIETARPIVTALLGESQVDTPRAQARVMAQVTEHVPLTEAGALDEAALRAATAAAISEAEADLAEARQAGGAGRVTGVGGSTQPVDNTEFTTAMTESFKRIGLSAEAAALAARGRV